MTASHPTEQQPGRKKERKISKALIYEEMDGQPIYYRGYKSVLNKKNTAEGIMGSSSLQMQIARLILKFLYAQIDGDQYFVFSGEAGMHLAKGNNLASDISIYAASQLLHYKFEDKYFNLPPKVIIEIDTKADLSVLQWETYLKRKSQKLLDWGVERILWILTASEQVILIEPNQDWRTRDWSKPVEIVEGCEIIIEVLVQK
jgi:hypothetical protein